MPNNDTLNNNVESYLNKYVTPFSNTAVPLEGIKQSPTYKMMINVLNKNYMTVEEYESISSIFNSEATQAKMCYMGWVFDFRPFLGRYWVRTKDNGILEIYSHNNNILRERFDYLDIVEVFPVTNNFKFEPDAD